MHEIWEAVPGYAGRYKVSNAGEVRNSQGKPLRWEITKFGYARVRLSLQRKVKAFHVHRIVGGLWVAGKTPERRWINHKNGVKLDNWWGNLEWVTHAENIQHAFTHGLRENPKGEEHHGAILTDADIPEIVRLHLQENVSQREIARRYGVNYGAIWAIFNKQGWHHVLSEDMIHAINSRWRTHRGRVSIRRS